MLSDPRPFINLPLFPAPLADSASTPYQRQIAAKHGLQLEGELVHRVVRSVERSGVIDDQLEVGLHLGHLTHGGGKYRIVEDARVGKPIFWKPNGGGIGDE